jgi:UDP-N-acetylmuramoyl-L-alanyl-D-glutamate--2,6-diaminopimelate ligase
MRLAELIESVPTPYRDVQVEHIVADSRAAGPGALFVACRGTTVDGHAFIADAARAGCSVVVGSDELPPAILSLLCRSGVPYVRVADSTETLGRAASLVNSSPSSALTVVGVTGTNGKTTVATLLYELFTALGHRCGLIATTGIRVGGEHLPNAYTTPDAVELQHLLARMVRTGCRHCFMEVTSHAIDQRRIAGVDFDGGIFTTLGHDHLDYHGTVEAYAAVKQRFLAELPTSAFALANADDARGQFMVATTRARVAFYGAGPEALLPWWVERFDERGMDVRLGPFGVRTSLVGEHNASNLAAMATTATLLGENLEVVIAAIPRLHGPRGRMQRIVPEKVLGIVDYAHTPEALRIALATARRLKPDGSLIVVAGCGGDRDRQKRPAMGALIATADTAILTSDNPRSEDPHSIVATMLRGVSARRRSHVRVELDRRLAIQLAARLAEAGDIILVAGKGHETVQEVRDTKHPWDDAAELRAALLQAKTLAATVAAPGPCGTPSQSGGW